MTRTLRRRRGGPVIAVAVDIARDAAWTRRWSVLLVVVLVTLATVLGSAGQAAVPFLVYGGL